MVYQFCKRTIEYISAYSSQDIDQDQQDIYIYGMECFINTAVPVIFLTIFSITFNSLFETWLWLFTFTSLRKYTGGYHAPTQFTCMAFSTCLGIGNTLAIWQLTFCWIPATILYFLCMSLVFFFCPLRSSKKQLGNTQHMRHKCSALGIMILSLLLSLFIPSSFAVTLAYSIFSCMLLVIIEIVHRKTLYS